MFRAEDVARITGGTLYEGSPECLFTGVSTDTRTLREGELFVGLRGDRFNGREFAEEAVERGAGGILIEGERLLPASPQSKPVCRIMVSDSLKALGDLAAQWRARMAAKTIGITGSVGKTTIKNLVRSALERCGSVCATKGNQNNLIGVPLTLFRCRPEDRFLVVEMGTDRPGEISRLSEVATPDVGIIGQIAPVHLERLGTLEDVAREKAGLFERLSPEGVAVLREDAPFADYLRSRTRARTILFGLSPEAMVRAEGIVLDEVGRAGFTLVDGVRRIRVKLGLLGKHQVWNALAAYAGCRAAGADPGAILAGIEACEAEWGRLRPERARNGAVLIEDLYNASPESMRAALDVLASVPARKRYAVLGDMLDLGPEAERHHRELGTACAARGFERVYFLGSQAATFAQGYSKESAPGLAVYEDRADLIAALEAELREGDVALVKASRGMRFEEIAQALKVVTVRPETRA